MKGMAQAKSLSMEVGIEHTRILGPDARHFQERWRYPVAD
jgi:hypothetical protein